MITYEPGQVQGRLTIIGRISYEGKKSLYEAKCSCGKVKIFTQESLVVGTQSCGCLRIERVHESCFRHGLIKTKEYRAWYHMHERCYSPNDRKFYRYGARGISVCERWHKDNTEGFQNFLSDMGPKPGKNYTLDRVGLDGNYTPENCRWADYFQQNNNRSNSVRLIVDGTSLTRADAAERFGVCVGTIERLFNTYKDYTKVVDHLLHRKKTCRGFTLEYQGIVYGIKDLSKLLCKKPEWLQNIIKKCNYDKKTYSKGII